MVDSFLEWHQVRLGQISVIAEKNVCEIVLLGKICDILGGVV